MFPLSDDVKLYANAGGYIGVGIIGVERIKVVDLGGSDSDEEEITYDKNSEFKRLDYGLTFGFGAEFKGFILGASYDLGLANIANNNNGGEFFGILNDTSIKNNVIKNNVIKITLGYRFGWAN